jgi:hypothetical protein
MLSAESFVGLSPRAAWLDQARVWEVGGWTAVLAAAAVLRLAALGDRPLGPDEAQPAVTAWRMWLENAPNDVGAGVLLLHALALSFGLLGASDLVARLPTVVAGLALVAAPLLLRPLLGAWAALAAGALLALSPMLVFGSRHVDPAILVPTLLALLVGVAARALLGARAEELPGEVSDAGDAPSPKARDTASGALAQLGSAEDEPSAQPSPRGRGGRTDWRWWAYAVPVLLALLLMAGSVAVPALLAVLGAALVTWWPTRGAEAGGQEPGSGDEGPGARQALASASQGQEPGAGSPERGDAGQAPGSVAGAAARARLARPGDWLAAVPLRELDWRLVSALFVGTLALVGTALFLDLRGVQGALVEPWVSWLAPYYPRATAIPWLPTLLVYDLPIVVLALTGIAVVVRRNQPFEHFLLWWTTLAALPLVFQPPDPLPYLLCWLLPLALLGGVALGSLAAPGWTWQRFGEDAVLAALAGVTFVCAVNTVRLLQSLVASPAGVGPRGRELAFSLLLLAFLGLLHWRLVEWWRASGPAGEPSRPLRVSTIVAVAVGLAFVLVANGRLQFADYGAGGAELLRPHALSPNVYAIAEELQTWARQEPSSPIVVGEALRPLLLWHLRDVPTARFQNDFPDALHTLPGNVRRGIWPAGPGAPEGERQPLDETISITPIPSTGALWNWWLYRNAWLVPTRHDIIVVR